MSSEFDPVAAPVGRAHLECERLPSTFRLTTTTDFGGSISFGLAGNRAGSIAPGLLASIWQSSPTAVWPATPLRCKSLSKQ
jgi:hypothetical protein